MKKLEFKYRVWPKSAYKALCEHQERDFISSVNTLCFMGGHAAWRAEQNAHDRHQLGSRGVWKSLTFVAGPVIVHGCGENEGDIRVLHVDTSEKKNQGGNRQARGPPSPSVMQWVRPGEPQALSSLQ